MVTPATTEQVLGTVPELAVFAELLRRRLIPEVDFTFQSNLFGGRLLKGGLVIDFLFSNPPNLAISVAGEYWHFERGITVRVQDLQARTSLASEGITLIFIEETDALNNAEFYVGEALRFTDHSRLA